MGLASKNIGIEIELKNKKQRPMIKGEDVNGI